METFQDIPSIPTNYRRLYYREVSARCARDHSLSLSLSLFLSIFLPISNIYFAKVIERAITRCFAVQ